MKAIDFAFFFCYICIGDIMGEILFYISNGLIIFSILFYVFLYLFTSNKKISDSNGFDIAKDMISEYDKINIIEGYKIISLYNIRRKVIKLSTRDYYGSDVRSISSSMIEAGISIQDNNKFINICSKIIPTLKLFELLGLIMLIVNMVSSTISDAKVGIIVVALFLILEYFYIDILTEGYNFCLDKIGKIKDIKNDDKKKIMKLISNRILINKMYFIAGIIMVIRFVIMIF